MINLPARISSRIPSQINKRRVSKEVFDEAQAKAKIADLILNDEIGKPFLDLMNTDLHTAEQAVLNNTIRPIKQEGIINGVMSILSRGKEEQIVELSGKYQAISGQKATLERWIAEFAELDKKIKDGELEIAQNP